MLTRLAGGTVYDPANGIDGQRRDLYLRDGRVVAAPAPGTRIEREIELGGRVVMPGAIDLHTHIAGGKVNVARAMLPEDHRAHAPGPCGHAVPPAAVIGQRYAAMGYTACFEPAVLPINARHAHLELGDIPLVDKGGYAMLGNDDFLLRMLAAGAEPPRIADYVGWTLQATQCIGIKVVNPGGISAFKFNGRRLDLDERAPGYGVTPRAILATLTRALHALGVPHPLHVHASNLGVPGNVATTLATMDAAEGLPIHLTHVQFHSYGTEGERRFSSAAAQVAEAVNARPNVSIDVGQIMFGQTITASGDTMRQYANRTRAHPKKWTCMDIECEAGCGVVPFRYRDRSFVNALQWAIGLEIFLLVRDPWRVFLTTDHPNGAPFTSYPRLIRLLMDRDFRRRALEQLHPQAQRASVLASLAREYSLYEIAIMTRAGPARILGLADRGHLGPGAAADITVYEDHPDRERMFARPLYVFKDGHLVARAGEIVDTVWGATHVIRPPFERAIERPLAEFYQRYRTVRMDNAIVRDEEIAGDGRGGGLVVHGCRP